MTALYVIGAIVLIVAVRILISVVVSGTVRAAARPIGKALRNRSIQNETERVARSLQAQQHMNPPYGNPPYGNPPYGAAQYPGPQPLNGQYGAPQPQYGVPQPQYGVPQPQYGAPQPQYAPRHRNNQPQGSGSPPAGWPQ